MPKHSRVVGSRARSLSLPELSQYFHLPINEVSQKLGLCVTVLKQRCREHGITRWPYRKVRKLDNIITALETTFGEPESHPNETEDEAKKRLECVRETRSFLLSNPNSSAHLQLGKIKLGKRSQASSDSGDGTLSGLSPREGAEKGPDSAESTLCSGAMLSSRDSLVEVTKGSHFTTGEACAEKAQKSPGLLQAQDLLSAMEKRDLGGCMIGQWHTARAPEQQHLMDDSSRSPSTSLFGNHLSAFRPLPKPRSRGCGSEGPLSPVLRPFAAANRALQLTTGPAVSQQVTSTQCIESVSVPGTPSVHFNSTDSRTRHDSFRIPQPLPRHYTPSSAPLASFPPPWLFQVLVSPQNSGLASPFTPSPGISPAGFLQWHDRARSLPAIDPQKSVAENWSEGSGGLKSAKLLKQQLC